MNSLRLLLLSLALTFSFTACGPADFEIDGEELELSELSDELTANSKFQTFKGKDDKFYFHLLAGNGEKVLQSQGYASLASAKSGINSVKTNGVNPNRYLFREAKDGTRYFVLQAANGKIIAVSEMYVSAANAQRGAEAVQNIIKTVAEQGPAAPGADRFETFQGLDKSYYWHLKAKNGQIILESQSYTTKAGANNAHATVRTNGVIEARYQVREAADGQFYFVLKAGNGKVIGLSEMYVSKANAERGIQAVITLLNDGVTSAQ